MLSQPAFSRTPVSRKVHRFLRGMVCGATQKLARLLGNTDRNERVGSTRATPFQMKVLALLIFPPLLRLPSFSQGITKATSREFSQNAQELTFTCAITTLRQKITISIAYLAS